MLRFVTFLTLLLLTPTLGAAQSLEGVWRGTEIEVVGGPNPGVTTGSDVQPRLLVYTEGYYSLLFVNGTEPRPLIPDQPTDADLVAAWGPFTAQAGTYEADDSTISYHIIVAKAQNGMLPENADYERTYTINGNTLQTRGEPNAQGAVTVFTYTRVE